MGSREMIQAEVFAPGAEQYSASREPSRHLFRPDWRAFSAAALILGLAIGWLLGSTSDITREAQVEQAEQPIEIPEPDTLAAPAIAWERSAVVPTADIGKLPRRIVLTAGGGLVPLHAPSPTTGSEIIWTFEGETAVATRWDTQSPFGFLDGALLGIGESAILAYDVDDLTKRPTHVLALQPELTVVRAQNETGLWIRREDDSLRYFDMVKKRFLTTYAQTADIPHLHGMTSTMLLWNDEEGSQAMPYDLSTLSAYGEAISIDLTGREELPLRGYSGNAIVFGGAGPEVHLCFPEDQTWITFDFFAPTEGSVLNAVVSPDRRYVVIIFGSEGIVVKAVLIDIQTGGSPTGFLLRNPGGMPVKWLDVSTLVWVGSEYGYSDMRLNMFDLGTGEQHILATLSDSDWRLIVEPAS